MRGGSCDASHVAGHYCVIALIRERGGTHVKERQPHAIVKNRPRRIWRARQAQMELHPRAFYHGVRRNTQHNAWRRGCDCECGNLAGAGPKSIAPDEKEMSRLRSENWE